MRALAWLLGGAAIVVPSVAAAEPVSVDAIAARAVERVCTGRAGQPVSTDQLAEALVIEARLGGSLQEMDVLAAELARVASGQDSAERDRFNAPLTAISLIEQALLLPQTGIADQLKVTFPAAPGQRRGWLFNPQSRHALSCAPAEAPEPRDETPSVAVRAVLRGDVEALDDTGEALASTSSARLSYERTRSVNLDGERSTSETAAINAAAGLVFDFPNGATLIPYAEYSRSSSESQASATAEVKAETVEALEFGVSGSTLLLGDEAGDPLNFRLGARAAITLDEMTGARYFRTNATADIIHPLLNTFRFERGWPLRVRATVQLEAEYRNVLSEGTATIGADENLFAVGGSGGLELDLPLDSEGDTRTGLVGSLRYTYLPVLTGTLDDIERVEGTFSFRWWIGRLGVDLGVTYADGTERKTFADENRLSFYFGVLFR